MKLGSSHLALVALTCIAPSLHADEIRLDDVVARAPREVIVREALEDNALLRLRHASLLEATGAEVSLSFPVPRGTRVPAGPITVRQTLALAPGDERIAVVEMTVGEVRGLLERGAGTLDLFRWDDRPLVPAGSSDSLVLTAGGVTYEIDLTATVGRRVMHFAWRGREPDSSRVLRVAATTSTLRRLGRDVPAGEARLQGALVARLREMKVLDDGDDPGWTLLPDYVTTAERPLIDRLVRQGIAPRDEVMRLYPDQPARRGDLAYWLARAFAWREKKLSGAYPDVPDSLEPWVDGLVKRRVLGAVGTEEFFQPFAAVRVPMVTEWCENAAREQHYALELESDRASFRRSLLAGTSRMIGGRPSARDTVSRSQLLGMISNARFPVVRVLETTDFHGAMEPTTSAGGSRGGTTALASTVAALRAENPEGTVLLDGGDAFQGTMISNLSFGRAVVEQMNRLGYTAMAIGNHEFDWSVDTLERRIDEMHFATLGANITDRNGVRPRWARADTLVRRRGVRLAVFGLSYPGTPVTTHPRNVASLRFADDSTTAAAFPARLRARGADIVIGLGHIPGTIDSASVVAGSLARVAQVRGVDAWLGGHSHTWVDGEVHGIPTLIPGSHGEGVAVCDLVVDPVRHRVIERRHRLARVDPRLASSDSTIAALITRWGQDVERASQTPIGLCVSKLGNVRGGESLIGSLVADVMRSVTRSDVALQNNGGLRAELPEGPVTRGLIYQVIPFENSIVTLDLTGAEIRQVLEESLAAERVIQVSGIRYRFDLGRTAGSRVTTLLNEIGKPLDERRTYRVACNDFMAAGGDDLLTLARARTKVDTEINLRDALEEEIRERSALVGKVQYQGDGRVQREPGSRPPARGD
jgi:2',3'-cyclic-nucleotide 2'-phosphodiesterase/3'-nucleotidase